MKYISVNVDFFSFTAQEMRVHSFDCNTDTVKE